MSTDTRIMGIDWVEPPPEWPGRARALTTTRRGGGYSRGHYAALNLGDHVGDGAAAVAANRRALTEATGVERVQWLRQVHGVRCVEADVESAARVPEADAAWTRVPGLGLAVLTADCVPLVLADRQGSVIGVAHGGWRGLVGGVAEALISALPAAPGDLVAWLGPSIGPVAYEVGEEVVGAVAALPEGESLMRRCLAPGARDGKVHLDLFELAGALLERSGVGSVLTDRLCTYTDLRFYSYRRDGATGRMATLAWLERS